MATFDVEQQIRELEDQRYAAMERGDADAIEALLHPQAVYTHSNGARDTRSSLVDKVRQGHFVYGPIEHPVQTVVVVGDTAVVTGDMRARVLVEGVARTLDNCALAVWTREGEGWLLLAYQPTPYPR